MKYNRFEKSLPDEEYDTARAKLYDEKRSLLKRIDDGTLSR